ncbi:MAG: PorV/PorQ family protein [Elusimicrobiales bacterium]|nr:PorV/PorQ family protein [Elusimicrobiales bacterium]
MNIFVILILHFINLHAYFTKSYQGTYASNIIKINPNPRCQAMAQACISFVNDASSLDINPASIINIKKLSIFASNSIYFENISMSSFFFARNLGKNTGTFGFGIKRLSWGEIEKTDEFANTLGKYSPYEMIIEAGFASYLTGLTRQKTQRIVFGGNGKLIINKIERTATTLSADIGFIFPYLFDDKFITSFVIQNIVGNIKLDKKSYPIPKLIKIGSSIILSKNFIINTDITSPQDSIPYISTGFEFSLKLSKKNYLYLRTGITSKNIKELKEYSPISLGIGIKYGNLYFDYSYSQLGYLGNVNKFSFNIKH